MVDTSKRQHIAAPTIGHFKRNGMNGARVFCRSISCGHMDLISFDDLGLSDLTPFPDIKIHRHLICQRCGSRIGSMMPTWSDPSEFEAKQVPGESG